MSGFRLGLTGSLGMGKSTTAALFAAAGIPVWDADAAVHRLYSEGRAGAKAISGLFPAAVTDGNVSRETLKQLIAADPAVLPRIEAVIHPLVARDRSDFIKNNQSDILVLDIPLLFEKGTEAECDAVLLVTAPAGLQRARVLARPGMTPERVELLLSLQMPDAEKRRRADHIVETLSVESTRSYVQALIAHIRAQRSAALA